MSDKYNWEKNYTSRADAIIDFYDKYLRKYDNGYALEKTLDYLHYDLQQHTLLDFNILLPLELLKWITVDYLRSYEKKPYGTYLYTGLYGKGKTQSMLAHVLRRKKQYPGIKVYSSIPCSFADATFDSIEELIELPGYSLFLIDELPNTFQARNWAKFPPEVIPLLTQQRKIGKELVCTAQCFEHVDKMFRDLTMYVVHSSNYFGQRLYKNQFFVGPTYESDKARGNLTADYVKMFVATDIMRYAYDSWEFVKALTKTQGHGREVIYNFKNDQPINIQNINSKK